MRPLVPFPILPAQIEAAHRLHARLADWRRSEEALRAIASAFPAFDSTSVLIKAAALDRLYSTNVYAIMQMASHVEKVMAEFNAEGVSPQPALVESLAKLSTDAVGARPRRHYSFASKFAHFFVSERFPIYDSYAVYMVERHMGRPLERPESRGDRYMAFFGALEDLKQDSHFEGTNRSLDQYLWLAGAYYAWKTRPDAVNVELRELFNRQSADVGDDLRDLASSLAAQVD